MQYVKILNIIYAYKHTIPIFVNVYNTNRKSTYVTFKMCKKTNKRFINRYKTDLFKPITNNIQKPTTYANVVHLQCAHIK